MSDPNEQPINPYQTPRSSTELPPVIGDFFRDGRFLVFRDRSELPMRCLINGEAVPADAWRKRKQISWSPPWIFIGLLGGLLPILLLMLITQKKANIVYSLGQQARSRIRKRQLMGSGFLLAFALILATGISQSGSDSTMGLLIFASLIALVLGLVILATASPFKSSGYRKGWFRMKGVSQVLLDELPDGNWKSI